MLGSAPDVTMGEAGETAVMRAAQVATASTARTCCMLPMSPLSFPACENFMYGAASPDPPPPPRGYPPPLPPY